MATWRYFVYIIIDKINVKIYVGTHKSYYANDDYPGSGVALLEARAAYEKEYGHEALNENFIKIILSVHDSEYAMLKQEKFIVNEKFVALDMTYNMQVGGGALRHWNKKPDPSEVRAFRSAAQALCAKQWD